MRHIVLLKTTRGGILDCAYWGSVFIAKHDKIVKHFGQSPKTMIFMRSLAKPLQASIICDYNIIKDYNLNSSEIAMFCGSHAGFGCHIKIMENLLKRFSLSCENLVLAPSEPLDTRDYDGVKTKLKNNCSAKHIMMLLMSKYLGFPLENYTNPNHPVQKLIYKKQEELSGEMPGYLTSDGCSTPLWAISYEGIIKAYYNLLNNKKYDILFSSIIENPELYGGYNRFDSEIIELSKGNLFSKVGAGGLVIVYNFKTCEFLLVKMAQNNNEFRRLITLDLLNKLGWIKFDVKKFELNQLSQNVAKYTYKIKLT